MKRQRNTAQMKEQTRNTEVQINEEEIGKLPENDFGIMIAEMIKNLENQMEKMQESINKDLEELKNKHSETTQLLKLKIPWRKSIAAYLQMNKSVSWNKVKRMKRTEDSLRNLCDHIKCTNIWIIRVPEEKEEKKVYKKIWRDYSWKFPQHGKEISVKFKRY